MESEDHDQDPFDLMGSTRRPTGTYEKSGAPAREAFKRNITQSLFADNPRYSKRKNNSAKTNRRPKNEIFKIMEGPAYHRQVVPYVDEHSEQAMRRQEENLSHNKRERIVFHQSNRSDYRARSMSNKAKQSVEQI